MPNEHNRVGCLRDHTLRALHILRKRDCGILCNKDFMTLMRQNLVDLPPAGGINKRSVHEDN